MADRHYSLLNRSIHKFASSRFGAWFGARALHHFDRAFLRLSGNRRTLTSIISGLPVMMLTTTGAKSGQPRSVPLICLRDEQRPGGYALIASNWGQPHYPAWYYNLKAHPRASGLVDGQAAEYEAYEASGEEYGRFWQSAADTYLGYNLYKQRIGGGRHIPIMVLAPVAG
jgi:deazaflavin-dependent oxidoreductase (nitroreductase family)